MTPPAPERSSEQLVRACLERIDEREGTVRAWTHLDPELAMSQARERDAAAPRSPLHGIPVGVKDIIDTRDLPTEYGSPIYAGHRPAADAACVERLRSAGAVVLGKTVTTEFALYHPAQTRNPHDPARTPGGSSSGSAAAVADGMVPLALGSQTAGSTIRPAAFCGTLGFKPTHGLLDLGGVKRLSARLDTLGLFARELEDLGALLAALGGPSLPEPGEPPRVGVVRTAHWARCNPDARAALETAARLLGAEEVSLPADFARLADAQETIMAADVAASLADEYERHHDELSGELRELIERGRRTEPPAYRDALELAQRCRAQLGGVFSAHDVLLTPAVLGEAPSGLEQTGDPIFCRAWTLLGTPAASVPGLTGDDALPLGVQLVGPPHGDRQLLGALRWATQALSGARRGRADSVTIQPL